MIPKIIRDSIYKNNTSLYDAQEAIYEYQLLDKEHQDIVLTFCENQALGKTKANVAILKWSEQEKTLGKKAKEIFKN